MSAIVDLTETTKLGRPSSQEAAKRPVRRGTLRPAPSITGKRSERQIEVGRRVARIEPSNARMASSIIGKRLGCLPRPPSGGTKKLLRQCSRASTPLRTLRRHRTAGLLFAQGARGGTAVTWANARPCPTVGPLILIKARVDRQAHIGVRFQQRKWPCHVQARWNASGRRD